MLVEEGQRVKLGEAIFTDKKIPGVTYTAPGAGIIKAINRGAKRALQSVVIELEGDEEVTFKHYSPDELPTLNRDQVQQNLVESGLWTSLRTRPYSKTPELDSEPKAIFITAIDTNPLAADPNLIINEYADDFRNGLTVLSHLTSGKLYLCQSPKRLYPLQICKILKHRHSLVHTLQDWWVLTYILLNLSAAKKRFGISVIRMSSPLANCSPQVTFG